MIYLYLALGLALRLFLAPTVAGHSTDINCWISWSHDLATYGIPNFYSSTSFCDYPPGYLYILRLLGQVQALVPESVYLLLLKLPAILCDCLAAYFIYRIAKDMGKRRKLGILLAFCYLFNPAVWVNSVIWGQVDAVFTLFLVLALYLLLQKKLLPCAAVFALSLLLKPQALLFGPVFLFFFVERLRDEPDKKRWLGKLLACVGVGLGVFFLLCIPFAKDFNPFNILGLYKETLSSYPYASVNAFNLYSLLGYNYVENTGRFLYLTFSIWGYIAIGAAVIYGGWLFLKGKKEDNSRYFFLPAMIMTLIFAFGTKMHERYLFPCMLLYIIAYLYTQDKRIRNLAILSSATQLVNIAYVLYCNEFHGNYIAPTDPIMLLTSMVCVGTAIYAAYTGYQLYGPARTKKEENSLYTPQGKDRRMHKKDWIFVSLLTLVYSVVAFWGLGDLHAPQNGLVTQAGESVTIVLPYESHITRLLYFNGIGNGEGVYEASLDGETWETITATPEDYCYTWYEHETDLYAKYIRFTPTYSDLTVLEVGLYDGDELVETEWTPLTDEQAYVPQTPSYKNSMYFDEVYHARTAYEHIQQSIPYENTHPPLGKLIISLGIRLFGMTPFGWRCMGVLFGCMMVPLFYLFAKKVFQRTDLACLAAVLLAVDFMHFEHSRIATIDTYGVFFILLMYYFMYDFYTMDLTQTPLKKALLPLLFSGLAFGLGSASKWIGIYAGAGLCVLFFMAVIRGARKVPHKEAPAYRKKVLLLCLWCVLCFGIAPFGIYYLSYLPILAVPNSLSFWGWQDLMFHYHAGLQDSHPYSSHFFQWPYMYKPLWMYAGDVPAGSVSTIVSFGNPAVWFLTIPCGAYVAVRWWKTRDKGAAFLLIAFLSQFLPWVPIARTTYIYHYYASIPFLILAICYCFGRAKRKTLVTYGGIALAFFLLYYPVLTGVTVPKAYVDTLRCFESWTLSR